MEEQAKGSSSSSAEAGMVRRPLISQTQRHKGGLITMPFIIANEALTKVASVGITPNMTLYLMGDYRLHINSTTRIVLLASATANLSPLVGAIIADSYLGRFLSVGLGSIFICLVFFPFLSSWWEKKEKEESKVLFTRVSCYFAV